MFDSENGALDSLLNHVYQKSISEVILAIMKIEEINFTDELAATIKQHKISVIGKLISKIASENDEETCLNAKDILQKLLEDVPDYL